ncbi:hypothetical protein [Amycolatopsis mediterranei]|uniref:hypothetical protein n=1 Tax=Amycolatopsis mediterranei TaxID=33910 RepID=UPI00222FF560|nr:hypothetical protein [Amycolatopsis mediterranei]UZF75434.1 hypothetical protein ISP_009028 [Amycolatopsis mediterranei]
MVGEETRMPRPLRPLPSLPDPELIKQLRAKAKKELGMSDRVAGAMSTLFVRPDRVLPQLDNLRTMRIPGGDLLFVEGEVWVPRLMADFSNPRNAADYTYAAAAGAADENLSVFTSEVVAGTAEIGIKVSSRDDLAAALTRSMARTRKNNELYPDISQQGIMDAPFGVMADIEFEDGTPPIAVPRVREGSTRTSWAQHVLKCTPEDTLFRMPSRAKPMSDFIDEINQIVAKPAKDITPEEQGRVRCARTNFILIVGFEPDEPGSIDLEEAIKVKVAQEHLNVKEDWSDNAQNSVLADDCLAAVFRAGHVRDHVEYEWLGGRLPFADPAVDELAENPDDRFARLMWLFTTKNPEVHDVIRGPIAFVLRKEKRRAETSRVQVRGTTKIPLAVELTAREFRGTPRFQEEKALDQVIKVLVNGGHVALANTWKPTNRSLTALTKAAVKDAEKGALGPASTELAVRALYYVGLYDVLKVPRNDRGAGSDRRKVGDVLQAMAETPAGVQQLASIVKDGRAGQPPKLRGADGTVERDGAQNDVRLTNDRVRYELFPRGGRPDSGKTDIDPFMDAQRAIQHALGDLRNGITALESVRETVDEDDDEAGQRLIEVQGLPVVTARTWLGILDGAEKKIQRWFMTGVEYAATAAEAPRVLSDEPDVLADDQDEDDESDE